VNSRSSEPATVAELVGRLTDVRDLPDLARLAQSCAAALACSRVLLGRLGPDGAHHPLLPAAGADGAAPAVLRLADEDGIRARLAAGVVVPVYGADPARPGTGAVLLVPVRSRGVTIGLLACVLEGRAPWSRRQISAARLVATVLGPVLDALTAG
jgi:GAF domain-containing protein